MSAVDEILGRTAGPEPPKASGVDTLLGRKPKLKLTEVDRLMGRTGEPDTAIATPQMIFNVQPGPPAPPPAKPSVLEADSLKNQNALTVVPNLGMNFVKNVVRIGPQIGEAISSMTRNWAVKPTVEMLHAMQQEGFVGQMPTAGQAVAGTKAAVEEIGKNIARELKAVQSIPGVAVELAKAAKKAKATDVAEWAYQNPFDALTIIQGASKAAAGAVLKALPEAAPLVAAPGAFAARNLAAESEAIRLPTRGLAQHLRAGTEQVAQGGVIGAASQGVEAAVERVPGGAEFLRQREFEIAARNEANFQRAQAAGASGRVAGEMGQALQPIDPVRFTRVVQGLEPVPNAATDPGMAAAVQKYAALSAQDQIDLIRRGAVSPLEAESRALQPARLEHFKAQAIAEGATPEDAARMALRKEGALGRAVEKESLGNVEAQKEALGSLQITAKTVGARIKSLEAQAVGAAGAGKLARAMRESGVERQLQSIEDQIASLAEQRGRIPTQPHVTAKAAAAEAEAGHEGATARAAREVAREMRARVKRRDPLMEAALAVKEVREDFRRGAIVSAGKSLRKLNAMLERAEHRLVKVSVRAEAQQGDIASILAGKGGPATRHLARLNEALKADLRKQGKAAYYFPHLEDPAAAAKRAAQVQRVGRTKLTRTAPGFLKRSTGALFAMNRAIMDKPSAVIARHQDVLAKWRANENLLNEIITNPAQFGARKIKDATETLPTERILDPALVRKEMRRAAGFASQVVGDVQKGTDVNDAFYAGLRKSIEEGGMSPKELGGEGLYAMPATAAKRLLHEYKPTGPWVKLLYDKPQEYWRAWVLALRPAWWQNNAISSFLYATLHGVLPHHYAAALDEQYAAKMPDALGAGGMSADLLRPTNLQQIARTDDELAKRFAGAYDWLEAQPGGVAVQHLAEAGRNANNAVESFFRRAAYLKASERASMANYVKRTNDHFYSAYNMLDEMDKLTPAQVRKAIAEVNYFNNDYINGLGPVERAFLRRGLPFVSFLKHQIMLTLRLPADYPGRALMLQQIARMSEDARQDAMPLPSIMADRGTTDTGLRFTIGGKHYAAFAATQGWNPFIIGAGPQQITESMEGTPLENAIGMARTQGAPYIQTLLDATQRKDAFGRPFTSPKYVKGKDQLWELDSKGNFVTDEAGRWVKAKEPIPGLGEEVIRSQPFVGLARTIAAPAARWTASPLATEATPVPAHPLVLRAQTKDEDSMNAIRVMALMRYFSPISIVLVDEDAAKQGRIEGFVPRKERRAAQRARARFQQAQDGEGQAP